MITVWLVIIGMSAGSLLVLHPRTWPLGCLMLVTAATLWWGLDLVCGPGPLLNCPLVQ